MSPLGSLSVEEFMCTYWHQKPVLIRGALAGYEFPVDDKGLLEMSCEPDRVSRIILEKGRSHPWQLEFGPFYEDDFEELPETHWTLLVQETDRINPDLTELMNLFRFIPNWRLDDVQISLAAPGGNAGPHIDNYDVFLIQAYGRRVWQIETKPAEKNRAIQEGMEIALLQEFSPDEEYEVEPGIFCISRRGYHTGG